MYFVLRLFYSNPNLTYSYLFRIKKEREEKDKKEKKKPVVSSATRSEQVVSSAPSAAPKMAGEGNIKV